MKIKIESENGGITYVDTDILKREGEYETFNSNGWKAKISVVK